MLMFGIFLVLKYVNQQSYSIVVPKYGMIKRHSAIKGNCFVVNRVRKTAKWREIVCKVNGYLTRYILKRANLLCHL